MGKIANRISKSQKENDSAFYTSFPNGGGIILLNIKQSWINNGIGRSPIYVNGSIFTFYFTAEFSMESYS